MDRESLEDQFRKYRDCGDPQYLAEVYDRTAVKLLSVAMHLCGDVDEAEDVVQATFLAALTSASEWQSDRPLWPWLLGILGNRVKRVRRVEARAIDSDRITPMLQSEPSAIAEDLEFNRAVDEAVASMPRLYQSVLVLRLKHGMAPADIAHALRRPPGTVRAQLARGLEMLRKALPVCFAGGLAMMLTQGTGLAAIRSQILEQAESIRAERSPPPGTYSLWAKVKLYVVGALVLVLGTLAVSVNSRGADRVEDLTISALDAGAYQSDEADLASILITDEGSSPKETTREEIRATGSLLIKLEHGARPAVGAGIRIEPNGTSSSAVMTRLVTKRTQVWIEPQSSDPALQTQTIATGLDGTCMFEGLEPGYWLVHVPTGSQIVPVRAGEQTRLIGKLDGRAVPVRGSVVDHLGSPVAGARIICSRGNDPWTCQEITTTDADGRFVVITAPRSFIIARKRGHAASYRISADRPLPNGREVLIQLPDLGSTLSGFVRDLEGRAIPGAVVQVGSAIDAFVDRPKPGRQNFSAIPLRVTADQNGHYEIVGLPSGRPLLRARARGYGIGQAEIELGRGEDGTLDLSLPRAGTLVGTVVDGEGKPATGTRIRVGWRNELDYTTTVTDDLGRFKLTGLSPGFTYVVAGVGNKGLAHSTLEIVAGEETRWDAVFLLDQVQIEGRVRLPDGSLLRNGIVFRETSGIGTRGIVRTDQQGRFRVTVPPFELDVQTNLLVCLGGKFDSGAPVQFPVGIVPDLRPGTRDLQIQLEASRMPTASLSCRLIGLHGGWPRWAVRLVQIETGHKRHLRKPATDDPALATYQSGLIPPGRYRFEIGPYLRLGPFEVARGQHLELGTLRVADASRSKVSDVSGAQHATRLLAFEHPADGTPFSLLRIEILDANGRSVLSSHERPAWRAWRKRIQLPVGRYQVRATTPTGLSASQEIVIADLEPVHYAIRIPLSR